MMPPPGFFGVGFVWRLIRFTPSTSTRFCSARTRATLPFLFFSEPEITQILRGHYQHGVRVMRTFGHNDGYGTTMPVQNPIQPRVGVFSEAALRRYDFVMDALSKVRSGQGLAASTALTAGAHVLHGV